MPDYDIYVLAESQMTISDGGQLDGVSQGSGVHLNGRTITLNSDAWAPISITDDDLNFQDSDGSQRLDGPTTIDGTTFASNSVVEAEYGLTVTDGTDTWTLIGFNVNNSSPAYATVEGLAFIGPTGGFPPVGVPLTVTSNIEGPSFAASSYATPICVVAGTRVDTPHGPRPIETLAVGDLVTTRDHGTLTVRWTGCRSILTHTDFAPVVFEPGALGNERQLMVSPQHRMLVDGWRAELFLGAPEVLIAAIHLVNGTTIRRHPGGCVTYHHILLDHHAVIQTEGSWSETFHPGKEALNSVLPAARSELFALFPELTSVESVLDAVPLGYPVMRRHEALALQI